MADSYSSSSKQRSPAQHRTIQRALDILESELREPGIDLNSPGAVKTYLALQLAAEEREVFCAIWLNSQHRLIGFDRLFFGSLTQTAVHMGEVARRALVRNSAAVIIAHNHPAGRAEPSDMDRLVTSQLTSALRLIDVMLLDHFIVAGTRAISMKELDAIEQGHKRARDAAEGKTDSWWSREQRAAEKRARQSVAAKAAWARRKSSAPESCPCA